MTQSMPIIALDIETKAGPGYETYENAALDHHRNEVTLVATYSGNGGNVHRGVAGLSLNPGLYVGHGSKFDEKTLRTKGINLTFSHDIMLMAVAHSHKIPEKWLAEYEAARKELNAKAGKAIHREARGYSLKTLAPYFLGVTPFWETESHDNEEYALKDAEYTYRLYQFFEKELKDEGGSWDFYVNKLLPWNRMLLEAELRGVAIDNTLLATKEYESTKNYLAAQKKLDELWAPAYKAYRKLEEGALRERYAEMAEKAVAKLKDQTKAPNTRLRYTRMADQAVEKLPTKMNLASPSQLAWILKDHLKLDISTFDSYKNREAGKTESTDKSILERLKAEGREDAKILLEFREEYKRATAFYPSYREMQWEGRVYTSYNLNGARTGRLSSNGPNLQQIPKKLLPLFTASPGYSLIYRDISAVEPRLVAYMTECPEMCRIFIEGSDFHSVNVRTALGIEEPDDVIKREYARERDLMKEAGLSLLYGAGYMRLKESAFKRGFRWTDAECKAMVKNFKEKYEAVLEYKRELEKEYEARGYVRNIFGRACTVNDEDLFMTSLNTVIQSGGSDLLLASADKALKTCDERNLSAHPLLFIHDSATLEAPTAQADEVFDILGEAIGSWRLETKWGVIPLKSEGKVCQNL